MQAFILAAGKGTRLYPFTGFLPKPLFPILGKPIIKIILDQLVDCGIKSIGVNAFHLKDKLVDFLKNYQQDNPQIQIEIFEEPELLGTGGALLNAKKFFKEPTLIINSDILTNLNFKKVFDYHFSANHPITMVMYKGENNNVKIDETSQTISAFRIKGKNLFNFAGIQIINPDIVSKFPCKNDLIEIYQELLNRGIKISAYVAENVYFKDIGTIKNYLLAHEDLLTRNLNIPFVPSYNHSIVIKNSEIGKNVIFNEWVYIEESSIEDNTSLSKVVSWKGAYIKSGKYKNCILI